MNTGTVTAIGTSRSGKPTVTIDGQIYSASKVDLGTLRTGDKISFDSASADYRGATVWFLNAWELVDAAKKYPPSQPVPAQTAAPSPVQQPQGGITEAERILAYGVVTEAIKAGRILEPEQLEKWITAAKHALRNQS